MKPTMISFLSLLFLELLAVATITVGFSNGSTYVGCIQSEREALLMILPTGFPLGLVMEIAANGMLLSAATSLAMSLSCTLEILSAINITHLIHHPMLNTKLMCGQCCLVRSIPLCLI
ncbi:hypothetical protein Ddye_027409 [Dipteronia dyeriana]|uniref:NADH dehydrogenase subunit 4L n=1 Tax=Dipteronia dyeriana TaxID=168575 RepID=A0AAD9WQ52_9ROSI|nr:hypothetical protein Ddye_027409 [Dipteronia dyeriana]